MGVFEGKNRISKHEFERAVSGLPRLTWKEKDYLKELFQRYERDGMITREELLKGLDEMEKNFSDTVTMRDVRVIREYLL